MGWQWHQLNHMQIIYTSLQTDNHDSSTPLSFYRLDALPAAQSAVSKHWKHFKNRLKTYLFRQCYDIISNFPDLTIMFLPSVLWSMQYFNCSGYWQKMIDWLIDWLLDWLIDWRASGEYLVSVKFNDQHIPDSPFKVCVLPAAGDSQRLHVHDLQQLGLQVICTLHLCGSHRQYPPFLS